MVFVYHTTEKKDYAGTILRNAHIGRTSAHVLFGPYGVAFGELGFCGYVYIYIYI